MNGMDVPDRPERPEDRAELEEHRRAVTHDRAYARQRDEQEIRDRAVAAFDHFIAMGFTTHLIAVQVRGAIEYRLALYPDGQRTLAVEVIRDAALDFNFDLQMEQDPNYQSGWSIMLYPLS